MNKKLLILAVAGFALASCSNDEVVQTAATSDANAISFRAFTNGMTRAADVLDDNSTYGLKTSGFYVFAKVYNGEGVEGADYFSNTEEVLFSWDASSSSYVSADKYYWPSSGALNFYAWQASVPAQVTHTALTKAFTVTPVGLTNAASASNQTDLVFANTNNKTKGGSGVVLNFRHTESKVIIKIKNTNPNLKFTVVNVAIGNLYGSGTYTYPGGNTGINTDTQDATTLSGGWTYGAATQTTDYSFEMSTTADYNIFNGTGTDHDVKTVPNATASDYEMILIPQEFLVKDLYTKDGVASTTQGDKFEGAYISAQLKIQNPQNNAYIAGGAESVVTAMWPLPAMTMNPGYKYTFTVDLAGGGYYLENNDTDSELDPILEGAEIRFVDVTVDHWQDGGTILLGNVVKGSTFDFNEAYNAAGVYKIIVSGLASGSNLAATLSPTGNLSGVKILDTAGTEISTTPASGVVTIEATLTANAANAAEAKGTITLTESGTATSSTVINIVQAAGPSYVAP